jgi:hypothetical protein
MDDETPTISATTTTNRTGTVLNVYLQTTIQYFNLIATYDQQHVSLYTCSSILPLMPKHQCLQRADRKNVILIHTYHSRFIPEGVTEVSQIFLRDDFYQN